MAKLKHLEHEIILDKKHLYEIEAWCKQHFGECWNLIDNRKGRWAVFWAGIESPKEYRWYFADERAATWFKIRWL